MKNYDLDTMNEQEVFDASVSHLFTQGVRSYRHDKSSCYYYDRDTGNQCAAGIFIPDKVYGSSSNVIEGRTWDVLVKKGIVTDKHESLIVALQRVHDSADPEEWPELFKQVAQRFHLNYNH